MEMERILTKRQYEIASLMAQGLTDIEIGKILGLKKEYVSHHIYDACERLGIYVYYRRIGLIKFLMEENITVENKKRKPSYREECLKIHKKYPRLTNSQIAIRVGCCRKTAQVHRKTTMPTEAEKREAGNKLSLSAMAIAYSGRLAECIGPIEGKSPIELVAWSRCLIEMEQKLRQALLSPVEE